MPCTRTNGPLTPSQRAKIQFERLLNLHSLFFSELVTLAEISTYYLLTVFPETFLSQWSSTPDQISDAFSRGHDIAHARRARCLAHVGLLDPSSMSVVIVIVNCICLDYLDLFVLFGCML